MILNRIRETAALYPDKVAIQMKAGDQYQQYTYRQLVRGVASLAHALAERGIGKGDRVAILSENRPEWMMAYLAVVSFGAVVVPLDAQFTEAEVALLLTSSGARAVFVSAACKQKLPGSSSLLVVSFDPADGIVFDALRTAYPDAALAPAQGLEVLAALLYTSGTTGDPKGVMLSHGNLAANLTSVIKLNLFDHQDNFLCLLPLHHSYPAMGCMLLPLGLGASVTILNSLKGPDILACLQETGVSVLIGVPQLYAALRRSIAEGIAKKTALVRALVRVFLGINSVLRNGLGMNIGKALFGAVHAKFGPRFRICTSGGARLEPDVYRDMSDLGFMMVEGYGLTETSPIATFNPLAKQKAGSIGIPVPDVEVRIMEPDAQGQGEIAVRGQNVMLGYYRKPQETAEVLRDGWFYTGDLGYRDQEGYFFITGRSKEMIVLATGKKVFPDELEKFYQQIPAIREICLLQGARGLEAAVVPDFEYLRRMNLSNSRETISFALEDLAKDLPPYKRISGFKIFQDPLPVTRLGKLKRTMVRDLYEKSGERVDKAVQEIDQDLFSDPVAKKLLACLGPFSAKKQIVPDDNLELDLGLDSLARVELVVSIEKTFGILLPESFGSEVFTVKDGVLRLRDLLAAGPVKTGAHVRSSWAEILAQEPAAEARDRVRLDFGPVCSAGRFMLKLFVTALLKVYGRLSVTGLENLPAKGPYIIAPNHLSLADAPSLIAALSWQRGSQVFFLGSTAFFGGTVTSRIAKFVQVIPVDMDTRLYNALQLSAYVLRQDRVLCVFPEGSRSRDGRTKEFKKGVGIIARELNIPLVPVAIQGTYEMLPTGKTFPKPSRVRVSFGSPVLPRDKDYDEIVKELRGDVVQMLGEKP